MYRIWDGELGGEAILKPAQEAYDLLPHMTLTAQAQFFLQSDTLRPSEYTSSHDSKYCLGLI